MGAANEALSRKLHERLDFITNVEHMDLVFMLKEYYDQSPKTFMKLITMQLERGKITKQQYQDILFLIGDDD